MMGIEDQIGNGDGYGNGNGFGNGFGNGYDYGNGDGNGNGYGNGGGYGRGYGNSFGDGYGYGDDMENPHCTRLVNGDNIAFIHCQQHLMENSYVCKRPAACSSYCRTE